MTAIYKNIEQTTHVASKRQQMELNFPHKNTDDVGRPTPHKKKRLREKFSRPYILNEFVRIQVGINIDNHG